MHSQEALPARDGQKNQSLFAWPRWKLRSIRSKFIFILLLACIVSPISPAHAAEARDNAYAAEARDKGNPSQAAEAREKDNPTHAAKARNNPTHAAEREIAQMQSLMDQYWSRGPLIQYDKRECASYVLDPLSDEVQTTNCSDFVHDFYLLNYGIKTGHSTQALASSPYIFHKFSQADWKALVDEGTWFGILKNNLQPGDLINVIYNDSGSGHVMMVYGHTEDDIILIHSAGTNYQEESFQSEMDSSFTEGSIRKQYLSNVFAARFLYNDAVQEIALLRPFGIDDSFEMVYEQDASGKDITKTSVSGLRNYVYCGKARRPAPVVADGGVILKKGRDYKVRYYHNIHAGIGLVQISGICDYTGTMVKTFLIQPKAIKPAVTLSRKSFAFNGTATASFIIRPARARLQSVTAAGKSLDVRWKARRKQVDGYQIRVLKRTASGTKAGNVLFPVELPKEGAAAERPRLIGNQNPPTPSATRTPDRLS